MVSFVYERGIRHRTRKMRNTSVYSVLKSRPVWVSMILNAMYAFKGCMLTNLEVILFCQISLIYICMFCCALYPGRFLERLWQDICSVHHQCLPCKLRRNKILDNFQTLQWFWWFTHAPQRKGSYKFVHRFSPLFLCRLPVLVKVPNRQNTFPLVFGWKSVLTVGKYLSQTFSQPLFFPSSGMREGSWELDHSHTWSRVRWRRYLFF